MISFEKFRKVLELRAADKTSNASLIAELERLKIENNLLRQQLEGKIYDL